MTSQTVKSSDQPSITTKSINAVKWLIRPHPKLNAVDASNATVLMIFLLGYFITSIFGFIFSPTIAIAGTTVFSAILYGIARMGYFRQSLILTLILLVMGVRFFFVQLPDGELYTPYRIGSVISWILIPIFIACTILSIRDALIMSISAFFFVLSFPLWVHGVEYSNLMQPISFPFVATVLTLLLALHRNNLENIRSKELEKTRQAQHIAEEANKTKSQFLANMSHELRTPLNAILNFSAFVADGVMGPVNNEQEEMLRQSISSGNHLLALINDVLDITKIEAGLMDLFIQPVDMNETLRAVESVGKGLVKNKDITLEMDIEDSLPTTYGDKRRLRQVFLNILSNAIKFTTEGEITIRAKLIHKRIRVEIKDTGIGIAQEDQTLVFESFKQAKHDIHEAVGTGLGMPISKHFVESHQGKIWLESKVGKGTTFFVELPVLTEAEAMQITMNVREQQ